MSTFYPLIIGLGIICIFLLAVVVALLNNLCMKQHEGTADKEEIHHAVENGINNALRRHEYEFTAVYAEERRLAEWLKNRLENDEINLASLAKETSERTIALTIKIAEDEVMFATNGLKAVLSAISKAQRCLATSTENNYADPVIRHWLTALKSLQTQEVEARERLTKAQANLEKVTELGEIANPIAESTSDPSSDCGEEQW